MIRVREGTVRSVTAEGPGWTEALADLEDGGTQRCLSLHALTGPLQPGDRVSLNTTAAFLGLGTGGYHFVTAVWGRARDIHGPGHIMKLRYTPAQVRVLAVEEEESPHHDALATIPDLGGKPVFVGTLHSQVPLVAAAIKAVRPHVRIAYVMTDGAALPAAFSRLLPALKSAQIIDAVITAGHAFGGDYECVTPAAGLAAAHVVVGADAVIVSMGPGVVGTGTPLGTTALEQGPLLDAAACLGGEPIAVVRASEADPRERHRGISHHVITALTRFTHHPVTVPLVAPRDPSLRERIRSQAGELAQAGHRIVWVDGEGAYAPARKLLSSAGITVTTMGRGERDDPLFFWSAAAAGAWWARRSVEAP